MAKMVNDKLFMKDGLGGISGIAGSRGLFADTEVIAGYGYHHSDDKFALSYFDEVVMPAQRNTVPISGVQHVLEMLFGVKGPIMMNTLYKRHGIGCPDDPSVPTFLVPENSNIEGGATSKAGIYSPGQICQLFGLGITGTAENNITVHKVDYRETDIEMDIQTRDGVLNGLMIPFRFTEAELDPNDRQKYFGKKVDQATGKRGYYLKRFESNPEIKHIWRSGDTEGSKAIETVATNDTVWDMSRNDALKSVVEIHFIISHQDLKEWFNYKLDQPENTRFNTIALFSGKYTEATKLEHEQFGDYCNVQLVSKLVIPTEPMSLAKDLEYIYRIYGS